MFQDLAPLHLSKAIVNCEVAFTSLRAVSNCTETELPEEVNVESEPCKAEKHCSSLNVRGRSYNMRFLSAKKQVFLVRSPCQLYEVVSENSEPVHDNGRERNACAPSRISHVESQNSLTPPRNVNT